MRKLKLQVQMTADGYIAGPNGEMDWVTMPWTDDINNYVNELTASIDTILLGRKLAEGFIPYWASVAANPEDPDFASGKKFTDTPKVVFTRTLERSEWSNAVLAKGTLASQINALKKGEGKDMIAYGGAGFVSSLIREGLIDEYHLFINPAAIGQGLAIFKEVGGRQNLKLVRSIPFECGIVLLQYEPNR
ncbi:MAG TPA: dihydrofolate reductase family protein [Flavisolibacter sp.]|nr:dihydrofolate reductase family protein [Flavisolibacter sp.]